MTEEPSSIAYWQFYAGLDKKMDELRSDRKELSYGIEVSVPMGMK